MSSFYGSYYWFAILVMAVLAITLWCWRCHKQSQARQEQILARNRHTIVQLQQTPQQHEERPSNYRPDAPPAYDDVVNKPDDYPVYYEGQSTSTQLPSSPEGDDPSEAQLPTYQDVVRSPGHLTNYAPSVSNGTSVLYPGSVQVQLNTPTQLEQRTIDLNTRRF